LLAYLLGLQQQGFGLGFEFGVSSHIEIPLNEGW